MVYYGEKLDDEKVLKVECTCGCGEEIKIAKDKLSEDKVVYYMILNTAQFYSKQDGIFRTIGHRIKTAFNILRGKEYRLTEVVLNEEDMKQLKEYIVKM